MRQLLLAIFVLTNDPWLLGYFIGNEPPWPGRETEIASAVLDGPASPIQRALQTFLADGDTPARRREFINQCVEKFLTVVNAAIRKQYPNHLNLGLRFGSTPSEAMLRVAHADVTDRPYTELVEAAKLTHARLLDVHSGKLPPVTRMAKPN
jgi:hypothetical protein